MSSLLDRGARNEAALRLAAAWCIALVFIVTCSSAYLRFSQAGLGCERWPECYGVIVAAGAPNLLGMTDVAGRGAAVESMQTIVRLAHRFAAMGVTILALVIALLCWYSARLRFRRIALAAAVVGLTAFLAILGRWTAGSKVPAVTLGNLIGGFSLLAVLWSVRISTLPGNSAGAQHAGAIGYWSRLGVVLIVLQVVTGGMMSAYFTAASCTGFSSCLETSLLQLSSLAGLNIFQPLAMASDGRIGAPVWGPTLHLVHKLGALAMVACVVWLTRKLFLSGGNARRLGAALLVLLLAQALLGLALVVQGYPLLVAVGHNLIAACLLLLLVACNSQCRAGSVGNPGGVY